ncbi:MAG: hypothetical protein CL840_21750 [Crocinitomicaceae bacterium]|nr:hypothetical protein [Crocinitomicaceae bacterium]|tara:strand:+ start:10979 stop:11596 length:618 start_codon:yes stop_codon:yes gene_type:complete
MIKLLWFALCFCLLSCNQIQVNKIAIQPYGNFNSAIVDTVKSTLEQVYGVEVVVLAPSDLPQSAFINIKSPRYRADSLIQILRREKPDSVDCVIGLTNLDISTTKTDQWGNIKEPESKYGDWGVFGLGYRPGASCVVSTHRIQNSDYKLFISRFKKICMHEIGHNLGLKHCTDGKTCVMRDAAEKISTVDGVELELCETCWARIN